MQAEDLMQCAALDGACGLTPSEHHQFMLPDLAHLEAIGVVARIRVLMLDDKDPAQQVFGYYTMLNGQPSITSTRNRWFWLSRCAPWRGAKNIRETYPEFAAKNFVEVR